LNHQPLAADPAWRTSTSPFSDLPPVPSPRPISQTGVERVQYDGELGELIRLFYVNLALSLVTLGFYRFWGKTAMRRYIWAHTSVLGERLEYLGTGKEMLLGFLKVVVYVAVLAALLHFLPDLLDTDNGIGLLAYLVVAAGFGFLYLAAQFAAQRYRLSRTAWCGIRGGMDGSAWNYAYKAGLLFIPAALIGLLLPWWRMACLDRRVGASRLGNARAYLDGRRSICFWSFMLGSVLLAVVNNALEPAIDRIAHLPLDPMIIEGLTLLVTITTILIIIPVTYAVYFANMQQEFFNNLRLGDLRVGQLSFASFVTPGTMTWQLTSAVLLLVGTLGLAWPLVLHRWLRFTAGNVGIHGQIDVTELRQATATMPKASEGLLEALDPGIL